MQDTNNQIYRKLTTFKPGKVFFPDDFQETGSSEAIRKALSRLEKKGYVKRIAKGIYFVPTTDPVVGIIYPSTEEIAKAIAGRDKARILPTGLYALNRLGLSTQIPLKIVYLTDGSARQVRLGTRTITFKAVAPRKLAMKGNISSLAIQALQELGPNGVTDEIRERLHVLLNREEPDNLRHDIKLAPAWIRKLLQTL